MEVIAVVVVVGILGSASALGLAAFLNGFMTGRTNAEQTQKAQNALQRLVMELRFVQIDAHTRDPLVTVANDHSSIVFTSKRDDAAHVVAVVGTELLLDGRPLTDHVSSFQAFYDSGTGEVRLVIGMDQIGSFETSVFP